MYKGPGPRDNWLWLGLFLFVVVLWIVGAAVAHPYWKPLP